MMDTVKRSVVILAAAAVLVPLALVAGPGVAWAEEREGCSGIEQNTGQVCARIDSLSPNSISSFGGRFYSIDPVVRPRLVAELLDENNAVVDRVELSWGNDRFAESVTKSVNQSFGERLGRVCATVYQAGELLNTACVPVPSAR